jgi:hypothetical protein
MPLLPGSLPGGEEFSFGRLSAILTPSAVVIDLAAGVQKCCSEIEQAGQVSLGQTKP